MKTTRICSERHLEGQRLLSQIQRLRGKGQHEEADLLVRGAHARRLIERGFDPALMLSYVVWSSERLEALFQDRHKVA